MVSLESIFPAAQVATVCSCSQFFAKHWGEESFWFQQAHQSGWLTSSSSFQELSLRLTKLIASFEDDDVVDKSVYMRILRIFRRREIMRLIWRQALQLASVQEVMSTMSWMADVVIHDVFRFLSFQHQEELMIIALGKWGGMELNLSSDIDLMFAFAEEGECLYGNKYVSKFEYFTHQSREVIDILHRQTAEGFVFRVDTRLRPYGDSGAIVMSFAAIESYYQSQGREWERYALIKSRMITGAGHHQSRLKQLLKPFVYRKYLDYSVIESLREMKELIRHQVKVKSLDNNIKLGYGGIREIEFIVQALQLIHGGKKIQLQTQEIKVALQELVKLGFLTFEEFTTLSSGYLFLRQVEHAIQGYADEQSHELPSDNVRCMALCTQCAISSWQEFIGKLKSVRSAVNYLFERHISLNENVANVSLDEGQQLILIIENKLSEYESIELLQRLEFKMPHEIHAVIKSFLNVISTQKISPKTRLRLNHLLIILWLRCKKITNGIATVERVQHILGAILKRSSYLTLLYEDTHAYEHLITLNHASSWFAEQIVRHPVLIDELIDPQLLFRTFQKTDLDEYITNSLTQLDTDDLEGQMDCLRSIKNAQIIRIAACDVTGQLPLMQVSDQLTLLAEKILGYVVNLALTYVCKKYPQWAKLLKDIDDLPLAICAYGKFAGYELSYVSDLDMVFLYDYDDVPSTIRESLFEICLRTSQRIMHLLTTPTSKGRLYAVDTRLRPSGDSGMLVTSMSAYFNYERHEAWTWEHQALVRSRLVYGNHKLKMKFLNLRNDILTQPRSLKELRTAVVAMRKSIASQHFTVDKQFDLKFDKGGIVDIEFLVQYWVLRWSRKYKTLLAWPDNIRLIEALIDCFRLDKEEGEKLINIYQQLREATHRLALHNLPGKTLSSEWISEREFVQAMWRRHLVDFSS